LKVGELTWIQEQGRSVTFSRSRFEIETRPGEEEWRGGQRSQTRTSAQFRSTTAGGIKRARILRPAVSAFLDEPWWVGGGLAGRELEDDRALWQAAEIRWVGACIQKPTKTGRFSLKPENPVWTGFVDLLKIDRFHLKFLKISKMK
jgi:hypothetical protein